MNWDLSVSWTRTTRTQTQKLKKKKKKNNNKNKIYIYIFQKITRDKATAAQARLSLLLRKAWYSSESIKIFGEGPALNDAVVLIVPLLLLFMLVEEENVVLGSEGWCDCGFDLGWFDFEQKEALESPLASAAVHHFGGFVGCLQWRMSWWQRSLWWLWVLVWMWWWSGSVVWWCNLWILGLWLGFL